MTVVLGYDDSSGAVRALQAALREASAFSEPLVLVYGAEPPGDVRGEEFRAHLEALREAGRTALDHAVETARKAGVSTSVEIIEEKPVHALTDAAARHDARLIVVGSWGESPIRGALLGSTPHKLLHWSNVPVLCVPVH